MNVLITGAAGFYGSHLTRFLIDNTDWDIVGLDRLDSAGNLNRLADNKLLKNDRFKFVFHDFKAGFSDLLMAQIGDIDIIFHVGAASHVDRSIKDPMSFVLDNVVGTANVLEYARKIPGLQKFFYFSTDEVFGSIGRVGRKFVEWDRYNSGNPYSATKAGGEELCLAYHNTYHLPIMITHCMNIFGERQHPEKFIPKIIRYIEQGRTIPIYADKTGTISGSRNYVYADTVSEALLFLMGTGKVGEKYNIEGEAEVSNMEMAQTVAKIMGKRLKYKMIASDNVRPGNDFAYGVDGSKLKEMGFKYKDNFKKRLNKVINWYIKNPQWYKL